MSLLLGIFISWEAIIETKNDNNWGDQTLCLCWQKNKELKIVQNAMQSHAIKQSNKPKPDK